LKAHKQRDYPSGQYSENWRDESDFAEVVEDVMQLSPAEKEELQELLKKFLVEERRREILENAHAGMEEMRRGELKFFSNVDELMDSLSHY
jgi:hypothetical protein